MKLYEVIDQLGRDRKTLIFCASVDTCERTVNFLRKNFGHHSCGVFHAKLPFEERAKTLRSFGEGPATLLVCTNLASRGLDFVDAEHVIQYDFAASLTDHLHRIGRTGRLSAVRSQTPPQAFVTNFFTLKNKALVESILYQGDQPLEASFSRKASFRKKLKKTLKVQEGEQL